ncbi:hypothetical protein JW930_05870 [Candidatus Woesearchaeota archaeon]|nr:hypothetical protein [Candidatus Woesearchaeota archaeon]
MKALVFDTGPLISLSLNNLLVLLPKLRDRYKGDFFITPGVRREAIERPIESKRFKFEALQVLKQLHTAILKMYENNELKDKTLNLLNLANSIFKAHDNYIKIVHYTETEVIQSCLDMNAEAVVIDEFITRQLIENPEKVKERLEKKLHLPIYTDENNLKKFQEITKGIKVIRSVELVTIAFELGLLDEFALDIPEPRKTLLDGLLWGVKLNGCSVSQREIERIIKIENSK